MFEVFATVCTRTRPNQNINKRKIYGEMHREIYRSSSNREIPVWRSVRPRVTARAVYCAAPANGGFHNAVRCGGSALNNCRSSVMRKGNRCVFNGKHRSLKSLSQFVMPIFRCKALAKWNDSTKNSINSILKFNCLRLLRAAGLLCL